MDQALFHESFDVFCSAIERQKATVLELACGPGNITQYLLQKRPDFQILGTDLAPKMLELARQNNPTAQFELRDCRDVLGLNQKFDGVFCKLSEHFHRSKRLCRNQMCHTLCKSQN